MISQTVEYALRAMMFLASLRARAATCATIAESTRVPKGYLSKIMRSMVCAELVESFRGPHGGFRLAREAENISLLEIVNAVEPLRRIDSGALEDPRDTNLCSLRRCLEDVLAGIERTLRQTTLSNVRSRATRATEGH